MHFWLTGTNNTFLLISLVREYFIKYPSYIPKYFKCSIIKVSIQVRYFCWVRTFLNIIIIFLFPLVSCI